MNQKESTKAQLTGIMGAMPEEIEGIVQMIEKRTELRLGGRTYHRGFIEGKEVVVVFSHWGKVAAAGTVTALLLAFGADEIIFTGVAGALSPSLNIGDIVIGRRLYQHDMDASPIIPRFELPLLGLNFLECSPENIAKAQIAIENVIGKFVSNNRIHLSEYVKRPAPKVIVGDIASGDRFISSENEKLTLMKDLPGVICVEMEGAAVAQICHEFGKSWTIIRIISDSANETAITDFQTFIRDVSSKYSVKIVKELLRKK